MHDPTSSTSKCPKSIKCKNEDSDVTDVAESSKIINGDCSLEKRTKETKKQRKNYSATGNMSISPAVNEYAPSVADEGCSENILKVKKKKHKKQTGDKHEHHYNAQSESFLNGINSAEYLETESSVKDDPDKRKKKKIKQDEGCNPLKKKHRNESTEFYAHDIYKQSEADNYISSTPAAKKMKKDKGDVGEKSTPIAKKIKKDKDKEKNCLWNNSFPSDEGDKSTPTAKKIKKDKDKEKDCLENNWFPSDEGDKSTPTAKKIKKDKDKEKNCLENNSFPSDEGEKPVSTATDATENSSLERHKVHKKSQVGSMGNLNMSKEKSGEIKVYSQLHSEIDISDLEYGPNSSSNDSEIVSSNKRRAKKKRCNKEVGQNSRNEEQEDNNVKKVSTEIRSDMRQLIFKKKKKKRKDISEVVDPWRDSVSSEFRESKKNRKEVQEISYVEPLYVNISSDFNSSKDDKKENKELVLQKTNFPFGLVDETEMNNSKPKLGLYSPSHSATVNTSSVQEGYDYENVNKSSSMDFENTSYINSIVFTDDPKGSEVESSFSSEDDESDAKTAEDDNSAFRAPLIGHYFDVDFKVPELHRILSRASKPTAIQRGLIASKGIKIKQGKFVKAEDQQIRENWKRLIEVSGLEDKPEYFFRLDNKYISPASKRNFLHYLARDMPERTPYAVYKRFKLLMAERKKGRYTSEENEFIIEMMKQKEGRGYCVKKIAEHLQRPIDSVEKRIKKIQEAHTRKIKWKSNNAAAFIKYLLKVTKIPEEHISELKNRPITYKEWEALSKKLDNVPVRILRRVWLERLHPALFIPEDFCDLGLVKLKLIQMFHENKETEWKCVNWNHYASQFEGLTSLRVYSLMKQLVKANVPEHKRDNLKRCIKKLMKLSDRTVHPQVIYKIEYTNGTIRESREKSVSSC